MFDSKKNSNLALPVHRDIGLVVIADYPERFEFMRLRPKNGNCLLSRRKFQPECCNVMKTVFHC